MTMYIRSAAVVSPAFPLESDHATVRHALEMPAEKTAGGALPASGIPRLTAVEPDYGRYIDPKMIRRMSRIVKMGVSAAMHCLKVAGEPLPGALITGTAYGCLEDTGIFLRKMIQNREELLSPTAFIQSTHNTVGAQIALLLKCHSYNNTIVHRSFSLEHSLTEAEMLLAEGTGPVLAGAVDELTGDSLAILHRFNRISIHQAADGNHYYPAGEGAAFFLLERGPSGKDLARIDHVATHFAPGIYPPETMDWIRKELRQTGIDPAAITTVLDGSRGWLKEKSGSLFSSAVFPDYKNHCGEFPTASGFGLWLAAVLCGSEERRAGENILLFNQAADGHYSLILVSSC